MVKNYQNFLINLISASQCAALCMAINVMHVPQLAHAQTDQPITATLADDAPMIIREQLAQAHRNNIDAMYEVALYLLKQRAADDDDMAHYAFGWALYAGRQGQPQASELTGSLYRRGIGVEQNYVRARKWLERALARNSKEANFELALLYADEGNPSFNKAKAATYLTEAIKLAEPRACLVSARSKIRDGSSFHKVIGEVNCAAEGGLVDAMEMLADFNLAQRSPYAEMRARKWLTRAAEAGSLTAAEKLTMLDEQ